MPPLFFVNRSAPPDRYRYTLAHEIGHIVMHAMPSVAMEKEADQFAAEFLMPRREIRTHFARPFTLQKAAELKPHWKVAMSALIRRAHDLDMISDRYYRGLMTQMSRHGYRLHEPVALDPEEPSIVQAVIDVHTNAHGYSIQELANLALLSVDDFNRYYPPPPELAAKAHLRAVK
jgi:Zn-dependent peptidase ImmA (M78 family)